MAASAPDDHLDRLVGHYGTVPVAEEVHEVPPVVFKRMAHDDERGAIGGASALPRRGGAVLLVRTIDSRDRWTAPGGDREPDESHEETAVRAVGEETGLSVELGPLLAAKRVTFVNEDEPGKRATGVWAWFGATDPGGRAEPRHRGVLSAGWFTELPESVDSHVAGPLKEWIATERETGD